MKDEKYFVAPKTWNGINIPRMKLLPQHMVVKYCIKSNNCWAIHQVYPGITLYYFYNEKYNAYIKKKRWQRKQKDYQSYCSTCDCSRDGLHRPALSSPSKAASRNFYHSRSCCSMVPSSLENGYVSPLPLPPAQ